MTTDQDTGWNQVNRANRNARGTSTTPDNVTDNSSNSSETAGQGTTARTTARSTRPRLATTRTTADPRRNHSATQFQGDPELWTAAAKPDDNFSAIKLKLIATQPPSNTPSLTAGHVAHFLTLSINLHRDHRYPTGTMPIALAEVQWTNTTPPTNYRPSQHKFNVTLMPAETEDAFDDELFQEVGLIFALQNWHLHQPIQFEYSTPPPNGLRDKLADLAPIDPPFCRPWSTQSKLHIPACNSFTESARGILFGLPAFLIPAHRRNMIDISQRLHDIVRTTIAPPLDTYDTFRNHIGFRSALMEHRQRGTTNTAKQPVIYICTTTPAVYASLVAAIHQTAPHLYGWKISAIPFPRDNRSQMQLQSNLARLRKEINDNFSHTDLKTLRNPRLADDDLQSILRCTVIRAAIPHFVHHDPSPEFWRIYVVTNLLTNDIVRDPDHYLRHLSDFPINLLPEMPTPTTRHRLPS